MKKLLSWILVLALCLSLFPGAALAEDAEEPVGEIAPVEEPVPPLEDEDGGLSGTPAPTEEGQAGDLAGDGVLEVPAAVPEGDPVASGSCGEDLNWAYYENGLLDITGSGAMYNWDWRSSAPWYQYRESITEARLSTGLTFVGSYAFNGCGYLKRVFFLGDAPSFSSDAFYCSYTPYIYATAFYPVDNETWTTDKHQNYGASSLTWIGYRDQAKAYTIHFDPNGGSSAPADQVKGHGVDVTLSTSKPILAGYRCLGWAETPDAGEPLYAPGALYSPDGDATLYAVWEEVLPGETLVAGGSCGADLNWAYYENGLLKIYGSGAMYNWENSYAYEGTRSAPWYQYRDSITELQLPEGLTGIGSYAFSECKYLTRLEIPASVTRIGNSAFDGCSGLSRVTIPSSVTSIGEYAFSYWHDGATRFYIDDLDWWLGLTDGNGQDLPHGDLYLNGVLLEEIAVPEGTLTLRPNMFRNARSLKRIHLPESLRSIDNYAFGDCRGLTELSIPAGVIGIGEGAFYNCYNLTALVLPESLRNIGDQAFSDCRSLTELVLPASLRSIGYRAFDRCRSLTELSIPAGVTGIGQNTFAGCSSLRSITIPDSVSSIGFGAFQMCTSLTEVRIPAEVTGIGDYAFDGCGALRRVDFLGDAPSISSSAFDGVRASALYPLENETWTEDLLQNYGGTLSWVPYRDGEAGTPLAYALHFDPNGGEGGPELQYKGRGVDLTLTETEPSRDYYLFQGWAEEAEADAASFLPGQSYGEDRELSLYAVWTPRTWELQYALNGGQGGPESQIKTYGAALTLPDTVPTREGFEFLGWSTRFGDSVPSYFPGDSFTEEGDPRSDEPITLYAVWQIKLFLVSYHPNGGEDAPPPQLKTYGRALTLSTDIPRRTGYTFLGWSASRSAAEPDYQPGDRFTENADRVLYAVWQRGDQGQPTEASLTPRDAAGCIGAEFTVDLMLEKNPGLMFLSFTLDYDDAVLEFLGAEDGALTGWTVVPAQNSLLWDGDRDHTESGCVLHLRFRAKAGLEPGTVRLGLKDVFAANYNEERLQIQAGVGLIRLADRLPGDVNGDGAVDGLDLIRLRKYLVGDADEGIVEANAKVNGDDTIDILDLVRLRKYLAKDDVILE